MGLKKVTIVKVFKNETNKDGIAYSYKNGKYAGQKFTRVSIKTDQTGEDMYSTNVMAGRPELNLEVGDNVLIHLYEENGFKNFKFPTKSEVELYNDLTGA